MTSPDENTPDAENTGDEMNLSKETVADLDAPENVADEAKGGAMGPFTYNGCSL